MSQCHLKLCCITNWRGGDIYTSQVGLRYVVCTDKIGAYITVLIFSVKYQLLNIVLCNQLSMKHKSCIFKQTRSFVGNILERRTLANTDKL